MRVKSSCLPERPLTMFISRSDGVPRLSERGSRIQGNVLLYGLLAALLGTFTSKGADLAVIKAPGTPLPDPRPAPGPIGGSGSGRWQFATPVGLFVVDPAVGEIAIQGATPGSPALVIVSFDKGPPPADTTVTLNGVRLIHGFGSPAGPFTVDP